MAAALPAAEPEAFTVLLSVAIDRLRVTVAEVCAAFNADKGTVSRWKNGLSSPAEPRRNAILEWLAGRLGGAASPQPKENAHDQSYPGLDALFGHSVPIFYRRGRHLAEPVHVDFLRSKRGVTVYLPEEGNRLRLGGTTFRLEAEGLGPSYHVQRLSAEFLHAFLDLHAADPLCHLLDWDNAPVS